MTSTCRGLVLRTTPYGESDRIVHLFTEDEGRLAVLAPRARRLRSRLRAVTEPLQEAIWTYRSRGGGGLARLLQAEVVCSHVPLHKDLLLCTYAAYWFELLTVALPEREPCADFYPFLSAALHRLGEGLNPELLTRILELRLVAIAGWEPQLAACVGCGATAGPWRFAPTEGGRTCARCQPYLPPRTQVLSLSPAVQYLLPQLVDVAPHEVGRVSVRATTHEELAHLCAAWLGAHFRYALRTPPLLAALRAGIPQQELPRRRRGEDEEARKSGEEEKA